ncbi:ThiF family adenylyltransferase [Desulfococcaceae bacterium HSG9]|nr:ThiF family adenylyltransferase [Desulfococcaceae bacterium HSG9]
MVIIPFEFITEHWESLITSGRVPISFSVLDDGDAYLATTISNSHATSQRLVNGTLTTSSMSQSDPIELPPKIDLLVRIQLTEKQSITDLEKVDIQADALIKKHDGKIEIRPVQIISVRSGIFSRLHGIYETDVLQLKTILIIGLGSGGAPIASELAKAGVGNFILVDHDRLEIGNIARHICGLSDLGRFKTKAVRDIILNKNPYTNVEIYQEKVVLDWLSNFQQLVGRADLVFCCTDNRESRAITNHACILENRVCIYGGTFRRAYGGQVLRVIPNRTMCYQCFIDTLVGDPNDQEISNPVQASSIAYADRPVKIEPGLATDIAPMSIMSVKLGILEMLRGTETDLKSLYEDLSAPLYQWLNRREIDTEYSDLDPMDSSDTLRILAWYGIENEKNPTCPVCGDFINIHSAAFNQMPDKDQPSGFGPASGGFDDTQTFPTPE